MSSSLLSQCCTLSHEEKQRLQLEANTKRQESLKAQIALVQAELDKKVPGTIRVLKRELKTLKDELKTVKILRGCLYNGGVW